MFGQPRTFRFEPKNIEAVTLNISTGECVRSTVCARSRCPPLWAHIESDNAVVVAHMKDPFTTIVGRWNLCDDVYEC
jgi:hypothetical protein